VEARHCTRGNDNALRRVTLGTLYFVADLPSVGRWLLGSRAYVGFGGLVTDPVQGLGIPFLLVGPLLAAFCNLIYLVVSLSTPAMDQEMVHRVCWDHPLGFLRGRLKGAGDPRVVGAALLMCLGFLYWMMR
jgi:hypothetical protein